MFDKIVKKHTINQHSLTNHHFISPQAVVGMEYGTPNNCIFAYTPNFIRIIVHASSQEESSI